MNTRLGWGYPGILTALPAAHTPVHGKKLTPSPPTSVEFGVDWQGKEGPWSFCDCSCCWLVFRASGIPLPLLPYHLCLPLISAVELTAFKLEESFTFNHQKKKKASLTWRANETLIIAVLVTGAECQRQLSLCCVLGSWSGLWSPAKCHC